MSEKKTLVLGASTNPERYAFKAINRLVQHHHPVVAVGLKEGSVAGVDIEKPEIIHSDINTISLYVGPAHQPVYYDYILKTKPERVIFNPGTENPEFQQMLTQKGIGYEQACTLVLLSIGDY
ncbi:CoA-binding protein [Solitalea sp. MAHUQ-68]|uniref:CoA-binding protein n=1 Tax=Solitalea agri TaxID=2953739 RepID=A0A9X2F241_9SPHI|nr:CoA-binding protein [Solitalea agri]MCO4293264.1 CoA-binding protein [Solitalea agri]